jgi:hypothetical protein
LSVIQRRQVVEGLGHLRLLRTETRARHRDSDTAGFICERALTKPCAERSSFRPGEKQRIRVFKSVAERA